MVAGECGALLEDRTGALVPYDATIARCVCICVLYVILGLGGIIFLRVGVCVRVLTQSDCSQGF